MSKPKVLYYAMCEYDSTSLYRAVGVLPYLPDSDYELVNGSKITDWNWSCFVGVSVFIFQRPVYDTHVRIIELAQSMNVKVILDFDDNLLAVPIENPTYQLYLENKSSVEDCLRIADEIWVTTQSIKVAYSHFNRNIHIIPNAHNDYIFPVEKKKDFNPDTKRVLWRGGHSHQADVLEVADDLVKIINDNKDWEFQIWGDRFIYMEQRCGDNYICRPHMETTEYYQELMAYNPNIVIFPLVDNEFNRGKSNICLLEATYAGAAFFTNKNLHEFEMIGVQQIKNLPQYLSEKDSVYYEYLDGVNDFSWNYIIDNLLLSNINKLRNDRLIANL